MEQPVPRNNLEAPTSLFSEEKEFKIEMEEKKQMSLEEADSGDVFFEWSDEELNICSLEHQDRGVRQLSSQRQRSLFNTLRYLHKGQRSTHVSEGKDWGFLATRRKRRTLSCVPTSCSCFTSACTEELYEICASKEEQSFQKEIETKATRKFEKLSWQDIKFGMTVYVSENNNKPQELELYLYKQQLTFYEEKVKPKYIVNLEDVQSVSYLKDRLHNTEPAQGSDIPFTIKGIVLDVKNRGSLQISCPSQPEVENLAVALRANELLMNDPSIKPTPRSHPMGADVSRISATQFKDKARSGDIVLFQTDNLSGKVIRKFTSGDYDHVAIVFNFATGKCGILESLQNTGVAAFLWDDLVKTKAWREYKRVVIRPLIIPPSSKRLLLQKIERFIFDASQCHLRYGLGATKMMRKKSLSHEVWDKNRTYFCSELVAKCLKNISLLRADPASCQYLPCDFSEATSINLLKGCYFGKEVEIAFEEVDLVKPLS